MVGESWLEIIDVLPEPSAILTADGSFVRTNAAFRRLFEAGPAAFHGKNIQEFARQGKEKVEEYVRVCSGNRSFILGAFELEAGGKRLGLRMEGAAINKTDEGGRRLLLFRFKLKGVAASQFIVLTDKIQALIREVRQRQMVQEELRRAQLELAHHAEDLERTVGERVKELEESKTQMEAFLYTISHDLRAPLRGIRGFAEVLREDSAEKLDAGGLDCLERIMTAALRMDNLINDLLEYSRVTRREMTLEQVALEAVVAKALAQIDDFLQARKAQVLVRGPLPKVWANQAITEHIFTNLVSNAAKFVAPGVEPRIEVFAEQPDRGMVRVSVKDNGTGIDPEHHERIFKIFEKLGNGEGTGIGLAIVAAGMERMNGRVTLTSAPGQGSVFHLEFPAAPSAEG